MYFGTHIIAAAAVMVDDDLLELDLLRVGHL